MKIQVLISTMHRKNHDLVQKMNINGHAILINQTDTNKEEVIENENGVIHFISTTDRGLSKSRNLAIAKSDADICVIADDDLTYEKNYQQLIECLFDNCHDCDIIAFDVTSDNKERPTKKLKKSKVNFFTSMKLASFQLAFRRQKFIDHGLLFNVNFGAGSQKFTSGEENLLLVEALKKGLKIKYFDVTLAKVSHEESTWYNGFDKKLFHTKGAVFYQMSNILYYPLVFQFAIRKYKYYKDSFSIYQALKLMNEGKKQSKNM